MFVYSELELLDSDIEDLKNTNMMEESQVIKMKAELACLEGKVCSYLSTVSWSCWTLISRTSRRLT